MSVTHRFIVNFQKLRNKKKVKFWDKNKYRIVIKLIKNLL